MAGLFNGWVTLAWTSLDFVPIGTSNSWARYSLVELYDPDNEGNEVKVDEGADVTVPDSESADNTESDEEALDKSEPVAVG